MSHACRALLPSHLLRPVGGLCGELPIRFAVLRFVSMGMAREAHGDSAA